MAVREEQVRVDQIGHLSHIPMTGKGLRGRTELRSKEIVEIVAE